MKNQDDIEAVERVALRYFPRLKHIFITLMSKDTTYPNVGWLNFGKFCDTVKFLDKACKQSDIDRLFIAVNFEVDDNMEDNPDKELCRYEFLEILVRIADVKYLKAKPPRAKLYAEAFEKLIVEQVFPLFEPEPWQEFRDDHLWCLNTNDVFEANLDSSKFII